MSDGGGEVFNGSRKVTGDGLKGPRWFRMVKEDTTIDNQDAPQETMLMVSWMFQYVTLS